MIHIVIEYANPLPRQTYQIKIARLSSGSSAPDGGDDYYPLSKKRTTI